MRRQDEESTCHTDEEADVARAMRGDEEAFGRLHALYWTRTRNTVRRIVGEAASDDIAQEAFIRAWNRLPSLRNPGLFGCWLSRIARNATLDHLRKSAREPVTPMSNETISWLEARPRTLAEGGDDDRPSANWAEGMSRLVEIAASVLRLQDRQLLELYAYRGLSPVQIAQVRGGNRHAAKQSLYRLRCRLRTSLQAAVLWHEGSPVCADLNSVLKDAGADDFGPEVQRVIERHTQGCPTCLELRATLDSVTALVTAEAAAC
jgi:RNA polymerase sigma factor (sigma-70 family)